MPNRTITIELDADQAAALGPDAEELADWLQTALSAVAAVRAKSEHVHDPTHLHEWIADTSALYHRLAGVRDAAVRAHQEAGGSVGSLSQALGTRRSTAQHHRARLTEGTGVPGPQELWVRDEYAVDGQAAAVPPGMEPWTVPWPGYTPPDVTEGGLRTREELEQSHAEWGAERYLTPYDIPGDELIARRADAWIPYEHDHRRWPLHPWGRQGRAGRCMRQWGENKCVDVIVVAGAGKERQVLAIWRSDNGRVALPGGHLDDGESLLAGALRELEEETGVAIPVDVEPIPMEKRIVDDHRATDHAWPASAPFLIQLDKPIPATAADDATHAEWLPFATMDALEEAAEGNLFVGHRPILQDAYEYLTD